MYKTEISLGEGLPTMVVYGLNNLQITHKPEHNRINEQNSELKRVSDLYFNEDLIEIDGVRVPSIFLAKTGLEKISEEILEDNYELPEEFKKFTRGVLESTRAFNGQSVSVADLRLDKTSNIIYLKLRKAGYFDFISTNRSVDIHLNVHDHSFPIGKTLRDYEIENGRSLDLSESNLANMLGVALFITSREEDYFLFVRRGKNLAVDGGTISCPGATPTWSDDIELKGFPNYLKGLIETELMEEVLLEPSEFKIENCYFYQNLIRGPEVVVDIKITPSIEDLAIRCQGNKSVLEESDRFYAVPAKLKAISSLTQLGYDVNLTTKTGAYLLKND